MVILKMFILSPWASTKRGSGLVLLHVKPTWGCPDLFSIPFFFFSFFFFTNLILLLTSFLIFFYRDVSYQNPHEKLDHKNKWDQEGKTLE